MQNHIERYWNEMAVISNTVSRDRILQAAEVLLNCHRRSGTLFLIGNGGSAATASHFACDLAKGTRVANLPPFRVIPLTDNVPLLTAWANDISYDQVFAAQLTARIYPNDVVIAISVSGTSRNVVLAAEVAQQQGATIIAMTGHGGGTLAQMADVVIEIPPCSIEQAEDAHLMIAHSMCVALRQQLQADVIAQATASVVNEH